MSRMAPRQCPSIRMLRPPQRTTLLEDVRAAGGIFS